MINSKIFYVREKLAYEATSVTVNPRLMLLKNENSPVDHGVIKMSDDSVYAILFCDELKNISVITASSSSKVLSLIFAEESDYEAALKDIKNNCPNIRLSKQNIKINSYANSISEKLRDGIEISIADAQDEDDVIICPVCGVANDKNSPIPFCMECGASLE